MKLNFFDLKTVQHSYTSAHHADGEARRTVSYIERAIVKPRSVLVFDDLTDDQIQEDLMDLAHAYSEAQKTIADLRSEVHELTEECHERADGADGARVVRDGEW